MTGKQKKFVQEYIKDLNATAAAKRAGYSSASAAESGCENLKNSKIQEAIAKAQSEKAEQSGINQEWVIDQLRASATRSDNKATHSGQNKALELLGRHLGLFDGDLKEMRDQLAEIIREANEQRRAKG